MDSRWPRPRRRFGQNFLHDRSVVDRIVAELSPSADTPVLEIGPGRGVLTSALLERVDRVVAVEVDRDLAGYLRETFDPARLRVVEQDVLDFEFAAAVREFHGRGASWSVAGNLPYNISKPIAMRLVESVDTIERAVLMFQREVARRLVAEPGCADYGPLSVLPRAVYRIRHAFDVPPGAFRPAPRVTSSVTVWEARAQRPGRAELARLRATLRAVFAARRKTLNNNVRRALGSEDVLERAGIDGTKRAQDLSPEALHALAALWPADA